MDLSLEGYVRSHFKLPHERFMAFAPGGDYHEKAEILAYHNIDSLLVLGYTAAHASNIGWYAATNSLHFYRFAQSVANAPAILAGLGVLGIAGLQAEAMQEFTPQEQLAILSGVPQPGSSQKQKLMTLSGL